MSKRTIWKFQINAYVDQMPVGIPMPKGARIVHVEQFGPAEIVSMWTEVNPDEEMVTRYFTVVGTGHPIPANAFVDGYRGTAIIPPMGIVLHVYEVMNKESL